MYIKSSQFLAEYMVIIAESSVLGYWGFRTEVVVRRVHHAHTHLLVTAYSF